MALNKVEDSHIYYNAIINNNPANPPPNAMGLGKLVQADFGENRSSPLLVNPSDFHLIGWRFKIPATQVPIYVPTGSAAITVLVYNGVQYGGAAVYPTNPYKAIPNGVYNFFDYIDIVNASLANAYFNLQASNPGLPSDDPPFLTYNPTTQLFSIYADAAVYDSSLSTPVYIAFNTAYTLSLTGFPVTTITVNSQPFQVYNIYTFPADQNQQTIGGITYDVMTQDGISLGELYDIQSIVITSSKLPTRNEAIPNTNGQSQDNSRRILLDFEPDLSGNTVSPPDSLYYQYYAKSSDYRLVDLWGNNPIISVDLQFYWQDKYQNLYPIYIEPGFDLTMKLLFQKKYK